MEAALPLFKKPEDHQYFGKLLIEEDDKDISLDEWKEREIMSLLLLVKNGTPPQSETALIELTGKAEQFGVKPIFHRILPLLMFMDPTKEERHKLVKVLDGVLINLGELVRPFTHKILTVIEPMLIDEEDNTRVEGRQVVSNLSKAVGLTSMIAAMRPDIDNVDEDVSKMTVIAFSVVASALGIRVVLPFLKGMCQSTKSWETRQTGMKIVQEIALLMGTEIVPHLRSLLEIIGYGVNDENEKVRRVADLSLGALAEAAGRPNGIESVDSVLENLQL